MSHARPITLIKTSYDRMWRVVRDNIDELGYVMAQMDKEVHVLILKMTGTQEQIDSLVD